ncbi:MAG: DUF2157 domain-containing protein [Syntrophaceae bacterium]|nr:DUF2157 domain-containing protein [Syntrophaceae bacterium]
MDILKFLQKLFYEKKINATQLHTLEDIHTLKIFSVHRELRLFLYIGILLIITGVGLTIKKYFANLGDIIIISSLTLCFTASFIYCFIKGESFSRNEVPSPNIAFDYVLFFGCAFFSMDIAYVETQFHLLGDQWNNYLLISTTLFFFLAYRFDNRLVLSLALSTFAAWFGFTLSEHLFSFKEYYREYSITYSLIVLLLGGILYRLAIKKHFFDIYLNFAVHFLCIALVAGVVEYKIFSIYFPALIMACAALTYYSVKTRKFLYMLYAVIYGYIGISIVILDHIYRDTFLMFTYFILTSLLVIGSIFMISRKFKENE